MERLRVDAADRTRILAHLGFQSLVLDADRRLLSPAPAPGLRLPEPFRLVGGRVTVREADAQAVFAEAVHLVLKNAVGWKTLVAVDRDMLVSLLHESLKGTPVLLAIPVDRHLDRRVCPVCLRSAFALSEREAELAALLGTGRPIADAARRLHMSLATARTHLRHIFLKMGIESQNALVALVAASAFGLCPGEKAACGCTSHG